MSTTTLQRKSGGDVDCSKLKDQLLQCRLCGFSHRRSIHKLDEWASLTTQPSQIMITRIRPSWWLPCLEFCWGLLTLALYKVHDPKQIYVLRAFVSSITAVGDPPADWFRSALLKPPHTLEP
jgi:hypothetical protein